MACVSLGGAKPRSQARATSRRAQIVPCGIRLRGGLSLAREGRPGSVTENRITLSFLLDTIASLEYRCYSQ